MLGDQTIRRATPAPFERPSVELGRHGRVWEFVVAEEVSVGDTVADFGVVAQTGRMARGDVVMVNPAGKVESFPADRQVRVFHVPGPQE